MTHWMTRNGEVREFSGADYAIFHDRKGWVDCEAPVVPVPPTAEELEAARQAAKSAGLKRAENNYILLMRAYGLPDKAGTTEIGQLAATMEQSGDFNGATRLAVRALAAINDVGQNGGTWEDIGWHAEVE